MGDLEKLNLVAGRGKFSIKLLLIFCQVLKIDGKLYAGNG